MDGATLIVEIIAVVVLAISAWAIRAQLYQQAVQLEQQAVQLEQQEKRHKADQIIAWKNSALGLNEFAMKYPAIFKDVLYPRAKDAAEVQKYTSAYSSLHALEVMYYMRRDEERESDRLDIFLREYVSSHELRNAWKVDAAQTAFTKEFQEKLNAVIEKYPLDPPQ